METAGIVLLVLGIVLLFASSMGIAASRDSQEEDESTKWLDATQSGGGITFFRDLFEGLREIQKDPNSTMRPVVVLVVIGALMLGTGVVLLILL